MLSHHLQWFCLVTDTQDLLRGKLVVTEDRPPVMLTSSVCSQWLAVFSTECRAGEVLGEWVPALLCQQQSSCPSRERFLWQKKAGSICPRRSLLFWGNMLKNCWKAKLMQNAKSCWHWQQGVQLLHPVQMESSVNGRRHKALGKVGKAWDWDKSCSLG